MEFSGTFELENTTVEEVWLALSDPVMIEHALPGCQFLVAVDEGSVDFDALREEYGDRDRAELTSDPEVIAERAFEEGDRYAALVQIKVGPVNPAFETVVNIDRREYPEMDASGEGSAGDSSFEMDSWMGLEETDDGVAVNWRTDADVFGRIAGMGQRVMNPVANRVVKRFFNTIQQQIEDTAADEDIEERTSDESRGIVDRVFGRGS
jgi:hypothetical protein